MSWFLLWQGNYVRWLLSSLPIHCTLQPCITELAAGSTPTHSVIWLPRGFLCHLGWVLLHLPALHLERGLIPTAHVLDSEDLRKSLPPHTLSGTGKQRWHLHFRMYTCKLHQSKDRLSKAMDQCSPEGDSGLPLPAQLQLQSCITAMRAPPSLPTLGLYRSTGMQLKPLFAAVSTVLRGVGGCTLPRCQHTDSLLPTDTTGWEYSTICRALPCTKLCLSPTQKASKVLVGTLYQVTLQKYTPEPHSSRSCRKTRPLWKHHFRNKLLFQYSSEDPLRCQKLNAFW